MAFTCTFLGRIIAQPLLHVHDGLRRIDFQYRHD